jgi:hypothetical protein
MALALKSTRFVRAFVMPAIHPGGRADKGLPLAIDRLAARAGQPAALPSGGRE